VLGVRNAEKWYQSCLDTIYQVPKGADRAGMEEAAKTDPQVKNVLGVLIMLLMLSGMVFLKADSKIRVCHPNI
jgi:hypothetical protein